MDFLQILTVPQIIDIILVAIILITAVKAFIDGFFSSVIRLLGNIASLVAAWIVSKRYSIVIFDSLFRKNVTETTYSYIQNSANAIDIQQIMENFAGGLPAAFMEEFVLKAESLVAQLAVPTMETAQSIVDIVIQPVLTAIISVVVFILVFVLCKLVVSLLEKLFKGLNDIPVIGFANRLGGFCVGVFSGVINVILISCLLSIIAIITQNSLSFINMDMLAKSRILALTAIINPFIM